MTEPSAQYWGVDPMEGLQLGTELERLPGVVAAAVWLDAGGGVRQVRVHAQPGASATILRHTIARVLEQQGHTLDPASLQIVPVAVPGEGTGQPGRFLVLHDIAMTRQGSRVTSRVRLTCGTSLMAGEAVELDTESGRARAAALATLRAAEGSREELALGLEQLAITQLFGKRYVVVSVEAALQRRFAQLSGIAPVDQSRSLEDAACMATLRAVERWLTL